MKMQPARSTKKPQGQFSSLWYNKEPNIESMIATDGK